MKLTLVAFVLALTSSLLVVAAVGAAEHQPTAFQKTLDHYEAVRLALMSDTVEGVPNRGTQIRAILDELAANWSAEAAGVQGEMAEQGLALLPELRTAAQDLATASTLEQARDAFYALSKPLVRWRKVATGERPTVAYCSMTRRSWLQPEGEIGNPYHGPSMLTCGEVVD